MKNDSNKKESPEDPVLSRRKFIRNCVRGAVGLSAVGVGVYSLGFEPHSVSIEHQTLYLKNLPDVWRGRKIAQVSDIHISRVVSPDFINRAFERMNREKPDAVFFTGDYVISWKFDEFMEKLSQSMKKIECSLGSAGKIAVPGNHDYWTSWDIVSQKLVNGGFSTPVNQVIPLTLEGETILIACCDDLWCGRIEIKKLLSGVDTENRPVILLSHNPDIFDNVELKGRTISVLSGHSHGGQVCLPFIGAPITPTRYVRGFFRDGNTTMYVNRGLGSIPPPVRFNCPPEITIFTLEKC
ncbi:MAG: metallophosphoesterase [Firmicutes bacterium]|nr:metallophosphoesterase [Bacillota bacterium]